MEYIKKYRNNIIITLFIIILIVVLYSSFHDITNILAALSGIKIVFLLITCFMMLLYYIVDGLVLHVFLRENLEQQHFKNTFLVALTAQFFNGITPFSTGGQPFQVYYFNKHGVKPNKATSSLILNFIIYQITITLLCLIALMVRGTYISEYVSNFKQLIIIGFSINAFVLLILLLLATSKKVNYVIIDVVIGFLSKIPLLHFLKQKQVGLHHFVEQYHQNIKLLLKKPQVFAITLLSSIIKMLIYYSIPIFIFMGLKQPVDGAVVITLIAISSFVWTITAFVPTPGATGGAEVIFTLLFGSIFAQPIVIAALLIWRAFTYYLGLLLGFLAVLKLEKE